MNRCVWKIVSGLFVLAAICGLPSGRIGAQAPAAGVLPSTIPVSPGPKTNLFNHVMKKAEVLAALAQVKDSQNFFVKSNAALVMRAASNTAREPWKNHPEADELWFIYRGTAKVSLAPFSLQVGVTPPGKTYDLKEGDVLSVPRGMAYQIMPSGGRFEYVALQKFAIIPPTAGRAGGPALSTSAVTTKEEIQKAYDAGIAGASGMQPGVSRIIFDRDKGPNWREGGAPGPWENHERNEHIDFCVYGTSKVIIDGFVTGADWDNRGLMGKGVVNGTEDTVGPGDIVFVFRNTPHFFDPISRRFGYLIVDMPQSEPYWPKAVIPNGGGAY
jgi:mannose-6-phosphate isomerase-like protein (cupin superfamily)